MMLYGEKKVLTPAIILLILSDVRYIFIFTRVERRVFSNGD